MWWDFKDGVESPLLPFTRSSSVPSAAASRAHSRTVFVECNRRIPVRFIPGRALGKALSGL